MADNADKTASRGQGSCQAEPPCVNNAVPLHFPRRRGSFVWKSANESAFSQRNGAFIMATPCDVEYPRGCLTGLFTCYMKVESVEDVIPQIYYPLSSTSAPMK